MTGERFGGWTQTFTGGVFWPLDPRADEIHVADIAHALSMLCRYNGHTRKFYSVAEHSVLMSRHVAPEHALWALLHDATEAYMGDMVKPLKNFMPDYVAAESRLEAVIAEKFGLTLPMPPEVKEADTRILMDERAALHKAPPMPWPVEAEPLGVHIYGWSPLRAETEFIEQFLALTAFIKA